MAQRVPRATAVAAVQIGPACNLCINLLSPLAYSSDAAVVELCESDAHQHVTVEPCSRSV